MSNLANWVHHIPYILPQGRVTWENPTAKTETEGEEEPEEEDADETEAQEVEPETGPSPLSPITADEGYLYISIIPYKTMH